MSASVRYEDYFHERLKDREFAIHYLNACLDTGDEGDFLFALREVAHVYGGLRQLAGKSQLNREHLFRMLSKNGNPELRSLRQIVGALGFKLRLEQRSPA